MISQLLKFIKEEKNEKFINSFSTSVNNSHRQLLLETAICYDNLPIFLLLQDCTSMTQQDYANFIFKNIKNQKKFRPEYCFYNKITSLQSQNISMDSIKIISKLGEKSAMEFLKIHPVSVYLHLTWFLHYNLLYKNEKFLETIFNNPNNKEQVILACMSVIHHNELSFLPIILEAAFEKKIDINFEIDRPLIQKHIHTYIRTTQKVDIVQMLIDEQIKAFEVILYDMTKNLTYSSSKHKQHKF